MLTVPAAKSVPTKFLEQTFIRIGSSKGYRTQAGDFQKDAQITDSGRPRADF